jgi:hypothetical protein
MPAKRRRRAAAAAVATVAVALGCYLVVSKVQTLLEGTGCRAGAGPAAVTLDPDQAAIAATIAGVASRQAMPARAVTIAYAAALQESHLHNLDYGDRDSVGVFQQRPSQGWGPARKLLDPVYASSKFFAALARVPGYRRMPVYQAAQAVQRSADGDAYRQYQRPAAELAAAFTGRLPHAVWCWPSHPSQQRPDLRAAEQALEHTFGRLGLHRVARHGSRPALAVVLGCGVPGWEVAAWLVTHASQFSLSEVRWGGFAWRSAQAAAGWIRVPGTADTGEVVAS